MFASILYITVALGLLAVGIWDVQSIIRDFMDDNRQTLVTVVNINDKIPFVQQTRFCIHHRHHFFENWPTEYRKVLLKPEQIWSKTNSPVNVDDFFITLLLYQYIQEMDTATDVNLFSQDHLKTMNITKVEAMSVVDPFITGSQSAEILTRIWDGLQPIMGHRDTSNRSLYEFMNHKILVDGVHSSALSDIQICFSIPLNEELSITVPSVTYNVDVNPGTPWKLGGLNVSTNGVYYIRTVYSLFMNGEPVQLPQGSTNVASGRQYLVTISNAGTFDTSAFPPCTVNFTHEQACLDDVRRRAIENACQCTQFSGYLKAVFGKMPPEVSPGRPFCTSVVYEKCLQGGNVLKLVNDEVRKAQEDQTCKPCIRRKTNSQAALVDGEAMGSMGDDGGIIGAMGGMGGLPSAVIGMGGMGDGGGTGGTGGMGGMGEMGSMAMGGMGGMVSADTTTTTTTTVAPTFIQWGPMTRMSKITFQCFDKVDVLYQDKEEFTMSQMIGQVGGGLGLYTGFSMLTIIEFILFSYTSYQAYRQYRKAKNHPGGKKCGFLGRYLSRNFERGEDVEGNVGNNNEMELKKLEQKFEREMSMMRASQRMLAEQLGHTSFGRYDTVQVISEQSQYQSPGYRKF